MTIPESKKKRVEIAEKFAKASEELLSSEQFFESIKTYSGSISPEIAEKVDAWKNSGEIGRAHV